MSEGLEAENFLYNAPQYCNLGTANADDDPQVEEYFNFNHENMQAQYEDVSSDDDSKEPFYTPLKLDSGVMLYQASNLRKSLSMGNLLPPPKAVSRPMSKERLNMLAQPKPRLTQVGFVSSAEIINKFHQKTPTRFRTTSARVQLKPAQPQLKSEYLDKNGSETTSGSAISLIKYMGPTIPQSPALATRARSRPTMYMPKDVRELQELEDMKKLKIKAMPIPKTNYGPALPVKVDKKPPTIVQPFNLTVIAPKKAPVPEVNPVEFHAKPIPKSILQKDLNETKQKPLKAIHTTPAPFSFQYRQDEMLKRRDQLITKVKEEEKKMREFHAQPIPKSVFKSPLKNGLNRARSKENLRPSNIFSAKSNVTNLSNTTQFGKINDNDVTFKAKPANVLKKQPFIPKLNLLPLTAISSFNLNTERRVAEREAYEVKVREMEEANIALQTAREQERALKEKAEVAQLRKQMEVKAQPIRHFKPLLPISPKPLTIPATPKFVQRKHNTST